jgi:hypothetical protein
VPAAVDADKEPTAFHALYVLYYAGHGRPRDGAFYMEKDQVVKLEDILGVWASSKPYLANAGCKLLIVADSCFSGAMATKLRSICTRPGQENTREAAAAHSVTIQAACGPRELSDGGVFTSSYVREVAKADRVFERHILFQTTRFPSDYQHPNYFCPWGEALLKTGPSGKPFPLYKHEK